VLTFGITIPNGGDHGASSESDFPRECVGAVEGCWVLTRDTAKVLE